MRDLSQAPVLAFRSDRFESALEFEQFRRQSQDILDARYVYERSLASEEDRFQIAGLCGPCLEPTRFTAQTSGGEMLPNQCRVPNWRESLSCDCRLGLISRYRAVLHYLNGQIGLFDQTRLSFFGQSGALAAALQSRVRNCAFFPRLLQESSSNRFHIPAEAMTADVFVSLDYLHHVPPLDAALAEICRVLDHAGSLVFTVPFYVDAKDTASCAPKVANVDGLQPAEVSEQVHRIGWDILRRLGEAGFSKAAAHLYWSEELGYLGPYNFIFSASR